MTAERSDAPQDRYESVFDEDSVRVKLEMTKHGVAIALDLMDHGEPSAGTEIYLDQKRINEISAWLDHYRTSRSETGAQYETMGYALAMRVLQSDLYAKLDDRERAECDELVRRGLKPSAQPCVVVPKLAWDGFVSMLNARLGKPTNRDKSPAEIIEMARAMLAAASSSSERSPRNG